LLVYTLDVASRITPGISIYENQFQFIPEGDTISFHSSLFSETTVSLEKSEELEKKRTKGTTTSCRKLSFLLAES